MKKELVLVFIIFVLIIVNPVLVLSDGSKVKVSVLVLEPEKNMSVNQEEINRVSNLNEIGELMSVRLNNNFFLVLIFVVIFLLVVFLIILSIKRKKLKLRIKAIKSLKKRMRLKKAKARKLV